MLLLYATLRSRLYQQLDQWNFNSASRDATGGTNGIPQTDGEPRKRRSSSLHKLDLTTITTWRGEKLEYNQYKEKERS